jgi:predicted MFS family arabinose efflux permease
MPISISGTAVALPPIAHDLGSDPTLLQWIVNGFNAAFALATLIWGVLSDRIGYRATFVLGSALMVVASAVSAVAPNLATLDIGRALAGIAGAAVFTGSSAILSNAYGPKARARNFAIFGSTIGLGVALGPTIAGLLASWIGWRGLFVVFGLFVAAALCLSRSLPAIRHEHVPGRKLIDFSLLRNPHFLAMCLVPVACAIGYVTMLSYLPVALSAVHGMGSDAAGLFMLPMTIPVLIGPALAGRLIHRFPPVTPMAVIYTALTFLVVGDLGLLLLGPGTPLGLLVAPMILLGFSFGLPLGLVDGEAIGSVPPQSSGTAAGVLNFLRLGSEAVVIAAYAAALTALIKSRIPRRADRPGRRGRRPRPRGGLRRRPPPGRLGDHRPVGPHHGGHRPPAPREAPLRRGRTPGAGHHGVRLTADRAAAARHPPGAPPRRPDPPVPQPRAAPGPSERRGAARHMGPETSAQTDLPASSGGVQPQDSLSESMMCSPRPVSASQSGSFTTGMPVPGSATVQSTDSPRRSRPSHTGRPDSGAYAGSSRP